MRTIYPGLWSIAGTVCGISLSQKPVTQGADVAALGFVKALCDWAELKPCISNVTQVTDFVLSCCVHAFDFSSAIVHIYHHIYHHTSHFT